MLILVCSKDYQQVVYYLQFIYTYMTMTTTTTKFVDQFFRKTNSSYDDTQRATRKCMHDDFYNVQNYSATLLTMVTTQNFVYQTIYPYWVIAFLAIV